MADNLFEEKPDYLIKVRELVVERDSLQTEINKMKNQQKKIEKSIASEEKSITDEINSTIKKRKLEIEDSYDERIDENRAKKKAVASKRDKKKAQRINKRIEEETKDVREDNRSLEVELKTLLKKNKAPFICKTKLFYIMFYARGIDEILLMLLSYALYFAGIPAGVMMLAKHFILKNSKSASIWSVIIVCAMVILQIIIYFAIYSSTKIGHRDVVEQARSIKDKMKANKRQANAIKNSIRKDKDESQYNLEAYDEKMEKLDKEADAIGLEKQDALQLFENETKQLIIDEINGRRLQAVDDMKAEKGQIENSINEAEKMYSEKALYITNNFAPYLGEELCKEEKLADLIALIDEGEAQTVSEAIALYKNQK